MQSATAAVRDHRVVSCAVIQPESAAHASTHTPRRPSCETGVTARSLSDGRRLRACVQRGSRKTSVAPIVSASRLAHWAKSRQRVTCALPGDPIFTRSSPVRLRFKRSMTLDQSLGLRTADCLPAKRNVEIADQI